MALQPAIKSHFRESDRHVRLHEFIKTLNSRHGSDAYILRHSISACVGLKSGQGSVQERQCSAVFVQRTIPKSSDNFLNNKNLNKIAFFFFLPINH